MIDEHKLLYVAGHNVVLNSTDDTSTQRFLPGSEDVEKITCIAVSPEKKWVAVCEKACNGRQAKCVIYDIHAEQKKGVLPDPDVVTTEYESSEFLAVAFSYRDENQFLVTLTGYPDFKLIFWNWKD